MSFILGWCVIYRTKIFTTSYAIETLEYHWQQDSQVDSQNVICLSFAGGLKSLEERPICPSLEDFSFTRWSPDQVEQNAPHPLIMAFCLSHLKTFLSIDLPFTLPFLILCITQTVMNAFVCCSLLLPLCRLWTNCWRRWNRVSTCLTSMPTSSRMRRSARTLGTTLMRIAKRWVRGILAERVWTSTKRVVPIKKQTSGKRWQPELFFGVHLLFLKCTLFTARIVCLQSFTLHFSATQRKDNLKHAYRLFCVMTLKTKLMFLSLSVHSGVIPIAEADITTMCLQLSSQPREYSYFSPKTMASWVGPGYWLFKPGQKRELAFEVLVLLCHQMHWCI